jgi:predicted TIM-barrel fold metal-dependent hydrolase
MPAKRFLEAKIVLAHCGGGGLFFGAAIIAALTCENIWLELSTLLPHIWLRDHPAQPVVKSAR